MNPRTLAIVLIAFVVIAGWTICHCFLPQVKTCGDRMTQTATTLESFDRREGVDR